MNARTVSSRAILVAAAVLVQVVLLTVAVGPQLMARVAGREYRLAVGPVDPMDPLRGAYVHLAYPGLPDAGRTREGSVFVPLVPDGETGLWKGESVVAGRPSRPPYLACDADHGNLRCGIDSLFVPQDEAGRIERGLGAERLAAVLRVDDRGHAAIVGLEPR